MGKVRLFITGMGGMAGQALAKLALNEGYLVGGTIHNTLPQDLKILIDQNFLKSFTVDLKDPKQTKKVFMDFQPDVVVHLAAKSLGGLDSQIFNPQIYKENITIFKNILISIKRLSVRPKLIISTGCLVYNKLTHPGLNSEMAVSKLPKVSSKMQPYRASKLDQERLLQQEKGIDYIITRPTQFTGPGKIQGVVEWYIAKKIANILSGKAKKIMVKNKLAEVDLLDVRDVARAYLVLIKKGYKGEIYHISSGSPTTVEKVAKVFLEVVRLNPINYPIESTYADRTYFRFSSNKLRKLGWSPKYSLEEALITYWRYFKNQNDKTDI